MRASCVDFVMSITEKCTDAIKLLLLKVLSLTYPLLAYLGVDLGGPILVHVPDEDVGQEVIDFLRGFGIPSICMLGDTPRKFEKVMSEAEYGVIILGFSHSRYTDINLQFINETCKKAQLDKKLQQLYFVFSTQAVPAGMQSAFAGAVYLGDVDCEGIWQDELTRPFITVMGDHQQILKARIKALESSEFQIIQAVEEAVKLFLLVEGIEESAVKKLDAKLDEANQAILRDWSSDNDPDILGEVFIDWVFDWLFDQEEQPLFLNRKDAGRNAEDLPDSAWLYDEQAYFIPDTDFTAICEPFASEVGINYLKRQLEIAGILGMEGNNRSYRTVTVWIKGSNGSLIKRRCVKLWRDKLDASTDISLFEYLKGGMLDNE